MATQMTSSFTIQNGTARIAFSHLCEKAPKTDPYDAGKYVTTIVIAKGSKDEQDIRTAYKAAADEALAKYNVAIPPVEDMESNGVFVPGFLKDGDKKNQERLSPVNRYGQPKEPQKPYEFLQNAYYFKVSSLYPIALYDIAGTKKQAFGPNGQPIMDGKNETYFIPNAEGSKVNFSIKFNVGVGVDSRTKQTYTFARPYIDWIQQIVEGKPIQSSNGPKAWVGAVSQATPQAQAPVNQVMPTNVAPQYQAQPQYQVQAVPQVPQSAPQYQAQPQVQPVPAMAPAAPTFDAQMEDAGFYGDPSGLPFPI